MTDLRQVAEADVFKAGRLAAHLRRTPAGVQFSYRRDYDGPPVASSLPLGVELLSPGGAVPPFFAGLLPEGRRLAAVRREVKTSADDDLTLLLAVGADAIGDVVVVPAGADPDPPRPAVEASDWGSLRFADLRTEAGFVDRVALPGVQEKLSTGMITLPVRLGSGFAIVKLDPPDYPHAVANEAYFLRLARGLRLPVVDAEVVHDAEGVPGLVVRRFDREVRVDGSVVRRAVEDATQALGRYPADKYALTSEQVTDGLASLCAARLVAARACFVQFAWAWLTGNGDLHGKNASVLQAASGEWRIAPIYDIPSTLPYGDQSMALPLQGATRGLSRKRFLGFGAAIGLPARAAERALDEALRASEPLLEDLQAGALPFDANTTRTLVRRLGRRRTDLQG